MSSNKSVMNYNSIEHIFTRIKQHNTKLRLLERHEIKNYLQGIELNTVQSLSEDFLTERCRDHLLRILKSYDEFELSFSGRNFSGDSSTATEMKQQLYSKLISRPLPSLHTISSFPLDLLTNDNFLTPESKENSGQHDKHLEILKCTGNLENTSLTMGGGLKKKEALRSVRKKRISGTIENKVPPKKKKRYSQESLKKENVLDHNLFPIESFGNSTLYKLENYNGNSLISHKELNTHQRSDMSQPLRHNKYYENIHIFNKNKRVSNGKIFDEKTYENNISQGVNPEVLFLQDQSHESNNDVYSIDLYDHHKNTNSKLVNYTQQIIDDSIVTPEESTHVNISCENNVAIGTSTCLLSSCNKTMNYAIEDMPIIFAEDNNEIQDILLSQDLQPASNTHPEPQSENNYLIQEAQPTSVAETSIEDQNLQWNFYEVKGDMSKDNLTTMLKECVENIKQCHAHLEEQFQIVAVEFGNKGVSGATAALKKMFSHISSRSDRLDIDAKLELLTELFENQTLNSRENSE